MNENTKPDLNEFFASFRLPKWIEVVRELAALLLWVVAFLQLLVFDVFDLLSNSFSQAEIFIKYRLVIILAFFAISWLLLGNRKFLLFFGYIVFYPVILIFIKLPIFCTKNWPYLTAFSPAIYSIFSNLRFNFFYLAAAIVASSIIIFTNHRQAIFFSIAILIFYLAWHFVRRFITAFESTTLFAKVGEKLEEIWDKARLSKKNNLLDKLDPDSDAYKSQLGGTIFGMYMMSTILFKMAKRLRKVQQSKFVDLYLMLSLIYTFVLTSIVYAITYMGIYKIDPTSFDGLGSNLLVSFFSYSIGALSHYQISTVMPVTDSAQFFTYSEVVASFMIIILLVFILLTSIRERYRSDLDLIINNLEGEANKHQKLMKENYELTVESAEIFLYKFNTLLARYMLKVRYGKDKAEVIEEALKKLNLEDENDQLDDDGKQES